MKNELDLGTSLDQVTKWLPEDHRSIEQRLAEHGLSHRRIASSTNTGKHEIFEVSTGKVLGQFTALESLDCVACTGTVLCATCHRPISCNGDHDSKQYCSYKCEASHHENIRQSARVSDLQK